MRGILASACRRPRPSGARRGRGAPLVALLLVALAVAPAAHADPAPTPTDPVPPVTDAPVTTTVPTSTPGATSTTVSEPPVSAPPGGFGSPPKPKPGEKPEAPIPDPSPQVRILLAQLRQADQHTVVVRRQVQLTLVRQHEALAAAAVRDAERALRRAERSVAAAQVNIRRDAVVAYVNPGQTGLAQLFDDGYNDDRSRVVLLSVTIEHERALLAAAQVRVADRAATLALRKFALAEAGARTAAAVAVVDEALADEARQGQELQVALAASPDWSLPIEGASVFTPAEIEAWFAQHGVVSRASAPVSELAYDYVKEGRDEGIRGDMAFAQSILETGSFTNRDTIQLNNFAGIGHCDTCPSGFAFATARLGVRAQIQLLKGYAQAGAVYRHPLVDGRLHGPSGCCQTWKQLTHTWATNPNYGAKLMNVYRNMLYWLVIHRGMSPDVGAT